MLASVGREDDVHLVCGASHWRSRHGRRGRACTRVRIGGDDRPAACDRKAIGRSRHHTEVFHLPRGGRLRRRRGRGRNSAELEIGDGTLRRAAVAQAGSRTARVVIELSRSRVRHPLRREYGGGPIAGPAALAAGRRRKRAVRRPGRSGSAEGASLPKVSLVGSKPRSARLRRSGRRTATIRGGEGSGLRRRCPSSAALADPRRHKPAQATARAALPIAEKLPRIPAGAGRHIRASAPPVGAGEVIVRSDHPWEYGSARRERGAAASPAQRGNPPPHNRRPLDTRFFEGVVSRVYRCRSRTDRRGIELREHAEYQLASPARTDGDFPLLGSPPTCSAPWPRRSPRLAGPWGSAAAQTALLAGPPGAEVEVEATTSLHLGSAGGPAGRPRRRAPRRRRCGRGRPSSIAEGDPELEGGVLAYQGRQVFWPMPRRRPERADRGS